jgi:hypothetical protein
MSSYNDENDSDDGSDVDSDEDVARHHDDANNGRDQ